MQNPNCDGSHCVYAIGEVRLLPTGGDSNAILCRHCHNHEMNFRMIRNRELSKENQFKLPSWESLRVYSSNHVKVADAQ